jgi:ATP-dependent DNA helicase RecG
MITSEQELAQAVATMRLAGTDLTNYELKSAAGGFPKEVETSFVALANTHGGSIIFGISEAHGFHPVESLDVKTVQQRCAQIARDLIEPPLEVDIAVMPFEEKPVVVVNVAELSPRYKPCYLKRLGMQNGSYVRTGDGDHKMSRYEINRFIENQLHNARNDAKPVEDATLDDLDQEALDAWLAHARATSFGRDAVMDRELLMVNRRVVAPDAAGTLRPTIAGLLALGAYPQKFFPRLNVVFTAYPTNEKGQVNARGQRFINAKTIDGAIPAMVANSVAIVAQNMRYAARITGAVREEEPEYPLAVMREAVANALMHRDYSSEALGTPVMVDLFPDRLTITNPGGLYGTITLDALGARGGTASRNQFLSRILEDAVYQDLDGTRGQVVENRGSGYPTILHELEQAHMDPPQLASMLDEFSFTVRPRRGQDDNAFPRQDVVTAMVTFLEQRKSASTSELAHAVGLSSKTTRSYINALVEQGVLEAEGSKNNPLRTYHLLT